MCSTENMESSAAAGCIPDRMQAVVAYGPGDYRLEEVNVPLAGPGEILIKVEACGICAGDIKSFSGAPSFWGDDTQPAYIKAPMIPGHEFIGRVVTLGEGVTDFSVGDRIVSEQIVPCWQCRFCKSGQYWMCQKHDVYGFQHNVNGAMAEYMKFPKEAINYRVPEDLPVKKAILIEPYACSMHAVERADIRLGDVVVIAGAGTLGLGMIGAAKKAGAEILVVLDMFNKRLELAKGFGADIVINPSECDAEAKIRALTDGYGCDVYIEATGHPASVEQGLGMTRNLGRFVEFSVFKDPVSVDWSIISDRKELDVLGSHLGPYCYPRVIKGIADGSLPTEGVVTHSLPLAQFMEGFELVMNGKNALKVVLVP
ncbi:MDR/zinc-dependent alcohol dehydrogenase-like family protein [Aliamphritea hakodatensis]|uniref:MDR/zinc-dependent alcohol dehydrogenase-like family protein n=1 Tax=Aliamphritea hakodatensis TaxID=2895352 RepID=UPI0022FD5156|nr:alcohol dehydrogenase catalytic domain-containing protein [Aliamphritea hakodatensis]